MKNKLLLKLSAIGGLSLLLLVPLALIEGKVAERGKRQEQVRSEIADSAAGAQTLLGPVCVIRYRELVEHRDRDEASGRETVRQSIVEGAQVLAPIRLDISGEAHVETRKRGLYHARLYHLGAQFAGEISVPAGIGLDAGRKILGAQAYLILGIADPRGIGNDPAVRVNGSTEHFTTGTFGLADRPGVRLELGPVDVANGARFEFAFPLELTGTDHLAIAPAGDATTVSLRSDWPHPSFQGRFLPTTQSVAESGFEARWQISPLARSFERVLRSQPASPSETLDIDFLEPVNVYVMAERAVKYGILFIVLTFAGFFLLEILRRLLIHPLQYLFVGLALAIFFLLLIALSEHIPFAAAYALSAAACVALIGVYLASVLQGRGQAAAFAGGIALLYAVLYGVLLSEDNALVMGSTLLFLALGATMLCTRRINWYRVDRIFDTGGGS